MTLEKWEIEKIAAQKKLAEASKYGPNLILGGGSSGGKGASGTWTDGTPKGNQPIPPSPVAPISTPPQLDSVSNILNPTQNWYPPEFKWFTNPDSSNVGILQDLQIRVFIMGIEVSDYLTLFAWSNNAAPDNINPTASIRLSGNNKTFIISEENIFGEGKDKNGNIVIGNWKDQEEDFRTSESVKHRLFNYKTLGNVYDLRTQTSRWNLNPNSCIFHSGDTIRAFARIPWTGQDAWLPIFTGYLNDPQVTQQATNQHVLDAQCVTISDKLNKARVHINSQAASLMAVNIAGSSKAARFSQFSDQVFQTSAIDFAGIFNDLVDNPRNFQDFLFNTSIQSLLGYVFYGNAVDAKEDSELTQLQRDEKNRTKETEETDKLKAIREIENLQSQLMVLKQKKLTWQTLDPPPYYDGSTLIYSPRLQSVEKKISELETEIKIKQEAQNSIKANPASNQNNQGQNTNPTDSSSGVSVQGQEKIPTSTGIIRKHGYGFLSPDLFIIEDFPLTGVAAVTTTGVTEVQSFTNPETLAKTTTSIPKTSAGFQKFWPAGSYNFISSPYLEPNHGAPGAKLHIHMGVDITTGKPGEIQGKFLYVPINGTISYTRIRNTGDGGTIELKGDDGYYHRFFHLFEVTVSENQKVNGNDIIGKIGGGLDALGRPLPGSGVYSTGSHLHWEVSEKSVIDGKGSYLDPGLWFNNNISGSSTSSSSTSQTEQPKTLNQVNEEIDSELNLKNSWNIGTIDLEIEAQSLAWWHARCLFGFANGVPIKENGEEYKVEDVDPEIYDPIKFKEFAYRRKNAWLNSNEVTFIGNNSDWLGVYSPHGKAVAVAYKRPKTGFGINGGISGAEVQNAAFETTTFSRAQIITDFLTKVDYRWWISGNGDVIVDFPHYDLLPENFAGWEKYLMIEGEIWNNTYKENFAEIPSTFIIRGGWGGWSAKGSGENYHKTMEIIYQLPNVLIRNGVKIQTFSFPHVWRQKQLAMLGMIQISKVVANAVQLPMSSLPPILVITPNCPIYLAHQDAYGLVDSTSFTWQIGDNKIRADLKIDVSAVRVRMTPEQAFLEDLMTQDEQNYQNKLQALRNDSQKDAIEKEKQFKLYKEEKFKNSDNMNSRAIDKWDDSKYEYLNHIVKYKHIQGRGSLMMDYRKTSEQNIGDADKFRTDANIDVPTPIIVGSPSLKDIQHNRTAVLKNTGDGVSFSKLLPIQPKPDSNEMFSQPIDPDSETQKKIDKAFLENRVNSNAQQGLMDHMNLVSGFQPNYINYNFDGSPNTSKGMGLLGLTPNVVDQLDSKPEGGSSSNLSDFKPGVSPVNSKDFSSLTSTEKMEINQKQMENHPFLDPDYSLKCGIGATKQLDKQSGSKDPLNPQLYSYAVQKGPNDPALQQVMKENDINGKTPENNLALSSSMQKWSYHFGNQTSKDLNYPTSLESLSSLRGEHG